MSAQVDSILAALAKAQGKIQPASKDKANPFFKSKYADLSSVWDACRDVLSQNGISVVQFPQSRADGLYLVSILGHSSGQWIKSEVLMPLAKHDPQTIGSTITYFRRYSLAALVGVAPEDDDGEKAQAPFRQKAQVNGSTPCKITQEQAADLKAILDECDDRYRKWVMDAIKKQYNAKSIDEIPFDAYDRIKTSAAKNMDETHAKQRNDAPSVFSEAQ